MSVRTPHLFLTAFEEGDVYSALADYRRFSTIDNQMNRIAELVGDGVVYGWEIDTGSYPVLTISPGSGLVNRFYVNTFNEKSFTVSDNSDFYVFAKRRVGTIGLIGPRSNVVSITYVDAGPPAEPSAFEASLPVSDPYFSVALVWSPVADEDLSYYAIERSTNGTDYESIYHAAAGSTYYLDSVDEDTQYYYRIQSFDLSGNASSWVLSDIHTQLSHNPPPDPYLVTMIPSERAINVLWKRPVGLAFAKLDHYELRLVELNTDLTERPETAQTLYIDRLDYAYRLDSLTNGQNYRITLKTIDIKSRVSNGFSAISTPFYNLSPMDPINISCTMSPSGAGVKLQINWLDGANEYDPAVAYRYNIYIQVDGMNESQPINVPIGYIQEQVEVFQLVADGDWYPIPQNTLVTVRVTAVDRNPHVESAGNYIRFVTNNYATPNAVTDFQATFDFESGQILATWTNPADFDHLHLVVEDDDLNTPELESTVIVDEDISKVASYSFSAQIYHRYTLKLTTYNEYGAAGDTAIAVEISLVNGQLPDLPIAPLASIVAGDRMLALIWSLINSPLIIGYRIYRSDGRFSLDYADYHLVAEVSANSSSFNDYGLENETRYIYYITSLDRYGRESLHLADGYLNLQFLDETPRPSGYLTEPKSLTVTHIDPHIRLEWTSLTEPFDGFNIYRARNSLEDWELIDSVSSNVLTYDDIDLPMIDGTVFYYTVEKVVNDCDIVFQTTSISPSNAICLAHVETGEGLVTHLDEDCRRTIKDLIDPITEYTNIALLDHHHTGIGLKVPDRINLTGRVVVTDWKTSDGKIFTTTEEIYGTDYILKVNDRFPPAMYSIDQGANRIMFSEAIATVDPDTGEVTNIPTVELTILGLDEIQGVLDEFRFNDLHARQVAYGNLAKAQIPDLNHDGRIKEALIPHRFELQRYSNNNFIVPEKSSSDQNFGDAVTFFSAIEGDGLIEEIVDFDKYNENAKVTFNVPSYDPDTRLNIKQETSNITLRSGLKQANSYRFDASQVWVLRDNFLYVTDKDSGDPEDDGRPQSAGLLAFDALNDLLYIMTDTALFVVDVSTGDHVSPMSVIESGSFTLPLGYYIADITFDPVKGKLIGLYRYDPPDAQACARLVDINLSDSLVTFTNAVEINGYDAGDPDKQFVGIAWENTTKYYLCSPTKLYEYESGGTPYLYGPLISSPSSHPLRTLTVDWSSPSNPRCLYSVASDNPRLVRLTVDSANPANGRIDVIKTYTSGFTNAVEAAPSDLSFWIENPQAMRIGRYRGFVSDAYLMYYLPLAAGYEISTASVALNLTGEGIQGQPAIYASALHPSYYTNELSLDYEGLRFAPAYGSIDELEATSATLDVSNVVREFYHRTDYNQNDAIVLRLASSDLNHSGNNVNAYSYSGLQPPNLTILYVISFAGVTKEVEGFMSPKAYKIEFQYEDVSNYRWVKIVTEDVEKPNPILNLRKRLRFRLLMNTGSVYLSLGIREIPGADLQVGGDGGASGPIEWVGVYSAIDDGLGNITPVGRLITAQDGIWQEIEFDFAKEPVMSYDGGNNQLGTKYGVLQHLAFTIHPDAGTGPFVIYLDRMEQIDDVMAAGTSLGIQVSDDFGGNWSVARVTKTAVHRFYRATYNPFVWAVSANEVMLATDLAYWFETTGLTGVQYIRDIVEDADGNMYVSTDKGVYWLDVSLIYHVASWKQCQIVSAFTTDCYGLYYNPISSGANEIWVSTELGIFSTIDKGETWEDTLINTGGYSAYEIFNIGTVYEPVLIAYNRKHILRKLPNDINFQILADFGEEFYIYDIWKSKYFSNRLYVSTGSGMYISAPGVDFSDEDTTQIQFYPTLYDLNLNEKVRVVFGMDIISVGNNVSRMFLGQENRLSSVGSDNILSVKKYYPNKEYPGFYVDDDEVKIGFVYTTHNNTLSFREPQPVTSRISSAYLPRRIFIAANHGWAQQNAEGEVFIYLNGEPTWIDFVLDDVSILDAVASLKSQLNLLPALTDFNSLQPTASEYLSATISTIDVMTGESHPEGQEPTPVVTKTTISELLANYSRFLSLVTDGYKTDNSLVMISIPLKGVDRSERPAGRRAAIIEDVEGFQAKASLGISIDAMFGVVNMTDIKTKFTKFDHLYITVFDTTLSGAGQYSHREVDDAIESINTGLTSHLSRVHYTNLIKTGLFLADVDPDLFETHPVSKVQSQYFTGKTDGWYDILNSTVDYITILDTPTGHASRLVTKFLSFAGDADPYYDNIIWAGSNSGIFVYAIDADSVKLNLVNYISFPGKPTIRDIYRDEYAIYVVAEDEDRVSSIFYSQDYGETWAEISTTGLPDQILTIVSISGTLTVGTESGLYYKDNDYGQWYESVVIPTDRFDSASKPITGFRGQCHNLLRTTFLAAEIGHMFYTSYQGIQWKPLGPGDGLNRDNIDVINTVSRFKNLTWLATNVGVYNDANTLLSDAVNFSRDSNLDGPNNPDYAPAHITDLTHGADAIYCATSSGKVYRYWDSGNGQGNMWASYTAPDVFNIHRLIVYETVLKHLLVVSSHNKLKVIDITPGTGAFG